MRPEQVETSDFGQARWDEDGGYWWFAPAQILRKVDLEPETLIALSEADAALGRLSGVGGMLQEPRLLARPYAVREALASARIEGTQASLTDVFQAEVNRSAPNEGDIAEVSSHVDALERGLTQSKEKLDLNIIRRLHNDLMASGRHGAKSGEFRRSPVWLGSPTARPETAIFVPPVGECMLQALLDLELFLTDPPRLPILVRAAILHYQFLTIHPFLDGNGRIGRMLVLLYLQHERRLSVPLLCVSPYFEAKRREYYDRLQAVRERGEIQQWLQFFFTAVAAQAEDGVLRARELLRLRESYRAELSGNRSRAIEVVETLFMNPVVTTATIRAKLGVTNQGALNLIRSLESRGWLSEFGSFGRGGATHWIASQVFDIIAEVEIRTAEESPA